MQTAIASSIEAKVVLVKNSGASIMEIQSRINSSMINGKEEAAGALRELYDAVSSKVQPTWDENPYPCWLAECPFCGNHHMPELLIHSQSTENYVWCPSCNARGPRERSETLAIGSWNRRAE